MGHDTRDAGESGSGTRSTIAAFVANVGIALAKLVAFVFTGSASMLAEAVHSLADSGNQGLLLWGHKRASRQPTAKHPFGFGRERYFWSFVVALLLFTAGSVFSLVEGEEKLRSPHELTSWPWAAGVLAVAAVMEAFSLRTAVRETATHRRDGESWWAFIRAAKIPELPVVLLEDTGALVGLGFAFAGVTTAELTGNARFDALGSLAIGLLLGAIAITLAVEMKSLLIGESASPEHVSAVCGVLQDDPAIARVVDLRTEHLGPDDLLVVASVEMAPEEQCDIPERLRAVEERLREEVPAARLVYLEPAERPTAAGDRGGRASSNGRSREDDRDAAGT
jgi:cation diffusion facilitator family transporter